MHSWKIIKFLFMDPFDSFQKAKFQVQGLVKHFGAKKAFYFSKAEKQSVILST